MTRAPRVAALLLLAGALLVLGAGGYAWHRLAAPVSLSSTVEVEIPRGTSLAGAVGRLAAAGVVRDPLLTRLLGRFLRIAPALKAGTFRFPAGEVTAVQALRRLTVSPERPQVAVTLPEGLNLWQVAETLGAAGAVDPEAFLAEATDARKATALVGRTVESLEGYLYPDTYRFHPGTPAAEVVATMVGRFRREFEAVKAAAGAAYQDLGRTLGFTDHDLVILASLVEKEARSERDRRLVARVLLNRLEAGWTLDVDPTCVYGPTTFREVPSRKRCRDPANRYSTYVHRGLPPGPIANPGRRALEATLNPDPSPEARQYFYYVLRPDGSGEHHFSRTRAEHDRAVRAYLRSLDGTR